MTSRRSTKRRSASSAAAKTRKAPAAHASDLELGQVMRKDGVAWIVESAGKSRRWNKASGYFTHDNGSRPFYVKFRDGRIEVLKWSTNDIYKHVYTVPKYEKIWIGINKGKYANPKEPECKGNSILVHVAGTKYVYIGDHIAELTINDEIKNFYGIMGNSDVVYAFAIGETNTYFFAQDDYLPNTMFKNDRDRYEVYYADDNWKKAHKIPRKLIQKRVEY